MRKSEGRSNGVQRERDSTLGGGGSGLHSRMWSAAASTARPARGKRVGARTALRRPGPCARARVPGPSPGSRRGPPRARGSRRSPDARAPPFRSTAVRHQRDHMLRASSRRKSTPQPPVPLRSPLLPAGLLSALLYVAERPPVGGADSDNRMSVISDSRPQRLLK